MLLSNSSPVSGCRRAAGGVAHTPSCTPLHPIKRKARKPVTARRLSPWEAGALPSKVHASTSCHVQAASSSPPAAVPHHLPAGGTLLNGGAPGPSGERGDAHAQDLQDIASMQLVLLSQLLGKSGEGFRRLRATVYVRTPEVSAPGCVPLRKLATYPPPPVPGLASEDGQQRPSDDVVVLRTSQAWHPAAGGTPSAASSSMDLGSSPGMGYTGNGGSSSSDSSSSISGSGATSSSGGSRDGAAAAAGGATLMEEILAGEEVLVLPSNGALVLPLAEGATLLGLLVVELGTTPGGGASEVAGLLGAGAGVPLCSSSSTTGIGQLGQGAEAGASNRLGPGSNIMPGSPAASAAGAAGLGPGGGSTWPAVAPLSVAASSSTHVATQGSSLVDGHLATPDPTGLPAWRARPVVNVGEEELRVLRMVAALLAKACAMQLRASVRLRSASAAAAVARTLVREAQRPASALATFSAMLLPRTAEGDPERDLAQGIAMQGKRLQELLRQLDAALVPRVPALGPMGSFSSQAQGSAGPGPIGAAAQGVAQPQRRLLQQQGAGAHAAGEASAQAAALQQAAAAIPSQAVSSSSLTSATAAAAAEAQPQPVAAAAAVSSSAGLGPAASGPPGLGSLKDVAAAAAALKGAAAGLGLQPGQVEPTSSDSVAAGAGLEQPAEPSSAAPRFRMRLSPDVLQSSEGGVIDLEPESATTTTQQGPVGMANSSSGQAGRGSASLAPVPVPQGPVGRPQQAGPGQRSPAWSNPAAAVGTAATTNLANALVHILTAAANLAAVQGVHFVLTPPLHVEPRPSKGKGGNNNMGCAGDGSEPRLKERPHRPIVVAAPAKMVQRIIAYVVDLALQCTPRGGQLCVSAAPHEAGLGPGGSGPAGGSWVQVSVLHTGRMVAERYASATPVLRQAWAANAAAGAAALPAARPQSSGASSGRLGARGGQAAVLSPVQVQQQAALDAAPQQQGPPGSPLLSFSMAEELVIRLGGSISCTYPTAAINSVTGLAETATAVNILLPGVGSNNSSMREVHATPAPAAVWG